MKKFGILFILIISYLLSACAIPSFPIINNCSEVRDVMKCADYDMNSVQFVGEWVEQTPEEQYQKRQYSMMISQDEFLLKLRPFMVKLRKYKKQQKKFTSHDDEFGKINVLYGL